MTSYQQSFSHLQISSLQKHFRSCTVSLLINKLEYWFSRDKFKEGFFKFSEPCKNFLYKEGDSWVEELSLGRKAFNAIFKLIGIRYKSKTLFLNEKDPFKGKLYASYYDRKTNRTFYIRNHDHADFFFQSLLEKTNFHKNEAIKKGKRVLASSVPDATSLESRSCKSQKGCYNIYNNKNTYKTSSFKKPKGKLNSEKGLPKKEKETLKHLLSIWKKEVGHLATWVYQSSFLKKLQNTFLNTFEGCKEKWESYCQKIASSKFLMGEGGSSFRIWIQWAIKPESVQRILEDGFTFGDRETSMQEESRKHLILNQERLNKAFEMLDDSKIKEYLDQYIEHMKQINPAISKAVKHHGLTDHFLKISFKSFVIEKIGHKEIS